MTLIECFDQAPVRNIVGCLCLRPQKLIFLGEEPAMRDAAETYRTFLAGRNQNTEIILRDVRMQSVGEIADVLTDIINSEKECVIDVTGGNEQVLVAVGMALERLDDAKRNSVTLQKFDLTRAQIQDCDGDGKVLPCFPATITAQELIALHGGTVHPRTQQPAAHYTPADLQPLWNIVRTAPRDWNNVIPILNGFERHSESKEDIYLPLREVEDRISNFEEDEPLYRELLGKLHTSGVIDDRSNAYTIRYSYLDPLLRECVKKAGNVLEIKTLLEARSLQQDGKPYFHDCQMSVTIDWDGIVHDPSRKIAETRNEIDLILIRGMVPLFVSCKNGKIEDVELYKLNSVAEHFGSPHARKLLIATELERKGSEPNYAFMRRAKDMGIQLVTDAAKLSESGWKRVFLDAMGE